MHRFFIPKKYFTNEIVQFPSDIAHQIVNVLRLGPGDSVIILDNEGYEYGIVILVSGKQLLSGKIVSKEKAKGEPGIRLGLFISLTQRDKFEWILQKGTEIGITEFIPFISKRSLVNQTKIGKKFERWQAIIREAAEQCGRGLIPELTNSFEFTKALLYANKKYERLLVAWEGTKTSEMLSNGKLQKKDRKIALFIGPEGGFLTTEMQLASEYGAILFSLGSRILRMETAAIVASTLVMQAVGEY